MAFHNFDAVSAVQDAREQDSDDQQGPPRDDISDPFMNQLKDMGIDIDNEGLHRSREQEIHKQENMAPTNFPGRPNTRQMVKQQVAQQEEDTIRVAKPNK